MPFSEKELCSVLEACSIDLNFINRRMIISSSPFSLQCNTTPANCFYTSHGRIFLAKNEEVAYVSPFQRRSNYAAGTMPPHRKIWKAEHCRRGEKKFDRFIHSEKDIVWLLLKLRSLYAYNAELKKKRKHVRVEKQKIMDQLEKLIFSELLPEARIDRTSTSIHVVDELIQCRIGVANDGTFDFSIKGSKSIESQSKSDIYMLVRFAKNFADDAKSIMRDQIDASPSKKDLSMIWKGITRNPKDEIPKKKPKLLHRKG